jgi:hypothetical protein
MSLRVRRLIARFAVVAGLSCLPVHPQETPGPAAVDIVSRVQKNVAAFQDLMPDFICDERVTKQEFEQGKVTREDRVISSFRVTRRKSPASSTSPMFIETREVISATVKGKPTTVRNYVLPIGVTGGFSDDLFYFFDKEKEKCFDIELAGSDKIRGHTALLLSIRVRDNVKRIGGRCSSLSPGKTSKAWVDSESMQIMRLQLFPTRYLQFAGPLSRSNGEYVIYQSIDYAEVFINGAPYWLPAAKRAEFVKLKGQHSSLYVVEYSNFHKFDVSAKVLRKDYKQSK